MAVVTTGKPDGGAATVNPLLTEWTGAFALPPFGAIVPEHFRPAFDMAMSRHRAEIDIIAGSLAGPSFDNTIEALERPQPSSAAL